MNSSTLRAQPSLPRWALWVGGLLTLLGAGWRLVELTEWPFPFHPTVQYETALAARTLWLQVDSERRTGAQEIWLEQTGFRHVNSPPLLPGVMAACYWMSGGEMPWVSKLLTGAGWLIAAWFIFLTVVRLTGNPAAGLISFAWFSFTPFGLMLSRSFQTDSILVAAFAVGVWWLSSSQIRISWRTTMRSGLVCGAVAFVKPGILFGPLMAGFALKVVFSPQSEGRLRKLAHIAVFSLIVALPSLIYAGAMLDGHAGGKILPGLLGEGWFYRSVGALILSVVGYPALFLSALGLLLATMRGDRLLLGLFLGYLGYVGIFTWHCATHDYYHAPLLVLVAVSLGWVSAWLIERLPGTGSRRVAFRLGYAGLACAGFLLYLHTTNLPFVGPARYRPDIQSAFQTVASQGELMAQRHAEVGTIVDATTKVVALTPDYGYALEYDGWVRNEPWPHTRDLGYLSEARMIDGHWDAEGHLNRLIAQGYRFFVITDFAEYHQQRGLQTALNHYGRPLTSTPELLLIELSDCPVTPQADSAY